MTLLWESERFTPKWLDKRSIKCRKKEDKRTIKKNLNNPNSYILKKGLYIFGQSMK